MLNNNIYHKSTKLVKIRLKIRINVLKVLKFENVSRLDKSKESFAFSCIASENNSDQFEILYQSVALI